MCVSVTRTMLILNWINAEILCRYISLHVCVCVHSAFNPALPLFLHFVLLKESPFQFYMYCSANTAVSFQITTFHSKLYFSDKIVHRKNITLLQNIVECIIWSQFDNIMIANVDMHRIHKIDVCAMIWHTTVLLTVNQRVLDLYSNYDFLHEQLTS